MERRQLNELCDKLSTVLVNYGMRYMFVKLYLPKRIPYMQLEGSPDNTCHEIVEEASRCGLLSELREGMQRLFPDEDFTHVK